MADIGDIFRHEPWSPQRRRHARDDDDEVGEAAVRNK